MRIAIIGASSGIGAELVKQARAGGHHAVAVARRMESQAAADLTPIEGSILDPSIAKRAIEGADAVAWCVGVKTLGPAALRKVTIFSEGTQRIIEAMKGAGVKRLAVITGIGAGAVVTVVSFTTGSRCPSSSEPSTPTRTGKKRS